MNMISPPATALTVEQRRRIEAIREARRALTAKDATSDSNANASDLIYVATWILDGHAPDLECTEGDPYEAVLDKLARFADHYAANDLRDFL